MAQEIDVLVDGGEATAGPPLGPALGPTGINVMGVVDQINEQTSAFEGMQVPVKVIIEDGDFDIEVGTPPTSALLKEELGIESGSGEPNMEKVADLSIEQAIRVSEQKKTDLLGKTQKTRTLEVLGTANSMGVTVQGRPAPQVQAAIRQGRHDDKFED